MLLAGRNQVMPKRSIDYTIRKFHSLGYDGIELSVVHGMSQLMLMDVLEDFFISHTVDLCQSLGFSITALAAHANYVTDDHIFEVQKRLLEAAPKYGTDIVIMSTGIPFEQREGHEGALYPLLETRTRELCARAEDLGVRIAIEVEPNQLFRNLTIFLDMADRINSPALKLNFDVGHIYLSEVDIEKAIGRCAPFIVHSHIDNMCMGEHCHKLPWDGEIDLVKAYRALKAAGFDGGVSLDVYLQDYEAVSPACVRYIKEEVFARI